MAEHDHRTCEICQEVIRNAEQDPGFDPEALQQLKDGTLVVPHGQLISRSRYPALYAAVASKWQRRT
jgi:hypothetical protein